MSRKRKRKRLKAFLAGGNLIPNIDINDLEIFTLKEAQEWVEEHLNVAMRVGLRNIEIKGVYFDEGVIIYCEPIDSYTSLIKAESDIGRYLKGGYYVIHDQW